MKLKLAVVGLAALGGAALISGQALAAMPNGIPQADRIASGPAATVDQVRRTALPRAALARSARAAPADGGGGVCTPGGRCFCRRNYYGPYGFSAAPRPFYGPRRGGGGGRRHWRRW